MPYTIEARCPCCGKYAGSYDEIELLFGWREVNGKTIPQSYCRACRSARCKAGEPCRVQKA